MRLNGCRERRLRTPRHREGGYFPNEVLRPYSRTDHAMVGAIAEVYKLGLSTRKIERPPPTSIQCLESAAPVFPVPSRTAAL